MFGCGSESCPRPCKRMDPEAYLTNQGWRGHGHPLHYSGRGIIKPLHLSQKANVFGVGKKQHDAHADQWWARAFDDTLKGLNTSKIEATGMIERVSVGSIAPTLPCVGIGGAKRIGTGNLYSNFVRGESLSGTLMPEEKGQPETQPQSEDYRKQNRGSSDADLPVPVQKGVESNKKKRRRRKRATAEYYKVVGCNAVNQDPKYTNLQEEHPKPLERRNDIDTNEQGRRGNRVKGAQRCPQAGASQELRKQPWTNTNNEVLTSRRLKERSKIKHADLVAARPWNMPPDGNTKDKSAK